MRWMQMRCVFVCVWPGFTAQGYESLSDFIRLLLKALLKQQTPFGGNCKITPSWCQYLIMRSRPGMTGWITQSVRVGQQLWCVSVWSASSFAKDLRPFPSLSHALAMLKSRTRFPVCCSVTIVFSFSSYYCMEDGHNYPYHHNCLL